MPRQRRSRRCVWSPFRECWRFDCPLSHSGVLIAWVIRQSSGPTQRRRLTYARDKRGTALALYLGMTTLDRTTCVWHCARVAVLSASLVLGASVLGTEAQQSASSSALGRSWTSTGSWTRLGHVEHALALSEQQARKTPPLMWRSPADAGHSSCQRASSRRLPRWLVWAPADAGHPGRHWPLPADPRRWPRLFANTTGCTHSFDPVLRRYRWQ